MATKRKHSTTCYTVEPGREIHFRGEPFISVQREGNTRPVDADEATRLIARLLNRRGCRPVRWRS